ncbi:hypothetical protein, partial [Celeribacter halophilus]|uniref:hypothetical protein n=1 Tax=Celeribacter halophilus TaxID=576117 RepID=UPI003A91625F
KRHQAIKPGSGRRMKNPWTPDLTIALKNPMSITPYLPEQSRQGYHVHMGQFSVKNLRPIGLRLSGNQHSSRLMGPEPSCRRYGQLPF